MATFSGVGRRVEQKGIVKDIAFYDDYAHHPNEIRATLEALRKVAEKQRLVVIFQPHRYSRTRDCFQEFPTAFLEADELIITDIYSAGEEPIEHIDAKILTESVSYSRAKPTHYTKQADMVSFLMSFLRPNDLVVTMGAGDITKLGPEMVEKLLQKR